jgi:hypothetical protein
MPQPNDLSRSLVALDQDSTIIAVVEMSQSSWLVAGMLPGIECQPRKKLEPSAERLADGLEVFGDVEIRFVERQWLDDRGVLSRAGIARPSRSSPRGADAKPGRQHRIGADADLDLASPLLGPAGDRHNRAQSVVNHG